MICKLCIAQHPIFLKVYCGPLCAFALVAASMGILYLYICICCGAPYAFALFYLYLYIFVCIVELFVRLHFSNYVAASMGILSPKCRDFCPPLLLNSILPSSHCIPYILAPAKMKYILQVYNVYTQQLLSTFLYVLSLQSWPTLVNEFISRELFIGHLKLTP